MPLTEQEIAALLAFVGVILGEVALTVQAIKRTGPNRVAKFRVSWFFWLLMVVLALGAATVAYFNHSTTAPMGWFYFGITFPVIVAQMALQPNPNE